MPDRNPHHLAAVGDWAARLRRKEAGLRDRTATMPVPRTALQTSAPRPQARLIAGSGKHGLASGELVKLHHSLVGSLDTGHGIIAQFVAPEPDTAIRDVVYDLAHVSADW